VEVQTKHSDPLYEILDILEPMRASLTQLEQKIDAHNTRLGTIDAGFSSLQQSWKDVSTRCDELDKRQPFGSKVYVPAVAGLTQPGRAAFENFLADVARIRYGVQPKHFTQRQLAYSPDGVNRVDGVARLNQTETTTTTGGFLVPEEIYPEVLAMIGQMGIARKLLRVYPMHRKDMKLPVRNTGPLVYWPGEGNKPTTSTVTLLRPELNAKTMMALDELSVEVDMDSIVPLVPLLTDLFAEAVALEEDKQAFNSATSPFIGALQAAGVTDVTMAATKTAFTDVSYDNVVNLKHGADPKVVQQGAYVFHMDVVGILQKIKDSTGQPIWREALGGALVDGPPGTILGRPYYTTNAMPGVASTAVSTPFMLYGDWKKWALGDRMGMQVDISSEAGFTEFTKWMRVVERVAFVGAIPGAFARLKTAAS